MFLFSLRPLSEKTITRCSSKKTKLWVILLGRGHGSAYEIKDSTFVKRTDTLTLIKRTHKLA